MAKNNMQIVIDFLINMKADKGQFDGFIKSVENNLKNLNPDLKLDSDQFKKELTKIVEMFNRIEKEGEKLSNIKIDADVDKVLKEFNQLVDVVDKIDLTDITKEFSKLNDLQLDDVANALKESFKGLDVGDLEKQLKNVQDITGKSSSEVKTLLNDQKNTLKAMKDTGQQGSEAYKKLEKEIEDTVKATKSLEGTSEKVSNSMSFVEKMGKFGLATQGITQLAESMNEIVQAGVEYEASLAAVGAITGQSGAPLEKLGAAARNLAKEFGGSATAQLASFQGVLSKMGAQVADTPEALAQIAKNINVLSAASGDDAATSMNAIVDSMLQFGLVSGDASKDAQTSTNVINALAASAQVGAAEIPQVAEAILQAGVAAKGAQMSFEQTNAAIQVLALGGKTGSEAGVALRNVLGLLQNASGPAEEAMKKLGTSSKELGTILTTQGLDAALDKLKGGMGKLETQSQKNVALMQIFGTETSAAAGILLDNSDKYSEFLKGIKDGQEGTGSAFLQAAQRMDTAGTKISILKAQVNDAFIGVTQTIGQSMTAALGFTAQMAPTLTSFAMLKDVMPLDAIKDMTMKLFAMVPGWTAVTAAEATAGVVGAEAGTATTIAWGPVLGTVAGIALALGGLYLFFTKTEKGVEIAKKLGDGFDSLLKALQPVFGGLMSVGDGAIDVITGLGEVLFEYMIAPFELAFTVIDTVVTAIFDMMGVSTEGASVMEILGAAFKDFGKTLGTIGDMFSMFASYIKATKAIIFGFIQSLPELLGAVKDLGVYYLNPANWLDDGKKGDELKAKIAGILTKAMDGGQQVIANAKLGQALENSLEIKGEIDKNNKLKELTDKLEKAKTDIEKQKIGEEIAKQVPGAVEGYQKIQDAQGNFVDMAKINIDKVKEFTKAQGEAYDSKLLANQSDFTKGLEAQAQKYTDTKAKVGELAKEIIEKSKQGIDTKDLQKQYTGLEKDLKKQSEAMTKNLTEANKVGVKIDGVKFSDTFTTDFAGGLTQLKTEAAKVDIGKTIADSVAIKGKIETVGAFDDLVTQFNNSKDEIEKASIAKQIQKEMPGAVKEIGTAVNAQGQLITQYSVSADAVKKFSAEQTKAYEKDLLDKQKAVSEGVKTQVTEYVSNADKLAAKQKEINDKMAKGESTEQARKEWDALSKAQAGNKDVMINGLVDLQNAGLKNDEVFNQIAKTLGKSPKELQGIVDKQKESREMAKQQAFEVSKIAEAWNTSKKALEDNISKQTDALSELAKKRADKSISAEERKKLDADFNSTMDKLKKEVVENKNLEKIKDNILIKSGQKEVKGKSAYELAKAEYALSEKDLELGGKQLELFQNTLALEQERQRTSYDDAVLSQNSLEITKQQRREYLKILEAKKLITVDENNVVRFTSKLKEVDQKEVEEKILNLNAKVVADESKVAEIKLKVKADEESLKASLFELQKNRIEWEVELGLRQSGDYTDIINFLDAKGDEIAQAITDNQAKIDEIQKQKAEELASTPEDLRASVAAGYDSMISELKKKQVTLKNSEITNAKETNSYITKSYEERFKTIQELFDKEKSKIELAYDKEAKNIEKIYSAYSKASIKVLDKDNADKVKSYEDSGKDKIATIERFAEIESISESEANRRKEELQREHEREKEKITADAEKRKLALLNIAKGAELDNNRTKNLALAKAEEKALAEQIQILQEKAMERPDLFTAENEKELNKLSELYKNATDKIQKNADVLTLAMGVAGEQFGEAFANMFAGDAEAVAENMRTMFGTIMGAMVQELNKEIDAAVLKLFLSWFNSTETQALPFFVKIAAIPAAHAITSSAVHAITDPIIGSLLSFSSGGRIDKPTMAMIGDGSKLGSPNREWIFNDPQLKDTIQMSIGAANNGLANEMRQMKEALSQLQIVAKIKGSDLHVAMGRAEYNNQRRAR